MGISKWDLFKKIEELPNEKYPEIKSYLDKLIELDQEVTLDEQTKKRLEKSLYEYSEGDYFDFDQVFEKGEE